MGYADSQIYAAILFLLISCRGVMKQRISVHKIIALMCSFLFLPSIAYCQNNLPALFKQVSPSVVVIYTFDKSGKLLLQGSGFFINMKGDVITNQHVIQGAYSAHIKTSNGKTYATDKLLVNDMLGDLVRLSTNTPSGEVKPVTLSKKVPETGEQIVVIGSPQGLEYSISDGIVSAVRIISGIGSVLQITAPISAGSSGSPVLNMQGKVVGVATSQFVEGQNLNFAMPCERVTKLAVAPTPNPPEQPQNALNIKNATADDSFNKGTALLLNGEVKKALPYLKKAAENNPGSAIEFFCLGACFEALGQYRQAVEAYKHAVRIEPDDADAYHNLGLAYRKLGQNQEAITAYKQAIRIKPDYAEAYNNLGYAYSYLEKYREAIEAYKEAIRIKPDYARAHYNLGVAYGDLGQFRDEIQSYKQAIRLEPDDADAYRNMGIAYDNLEQFREAILAYKKATQLKPDDVRVLLLLGIAYDSLGEFRNEIQAYKQAIRIKPDYADAHYGLGNAYINIHDNNAALEEYKILKELDVELANNLFNSIDK